MIGLWIILGIAFIVGLLVQNQLRAKFREYSKVPINSGLTGSEVARQMLHDHGIYDVSVVSVPGELTDHYNPVKKTVNLSPEVYNGSNVAAAAVAAHECGHAVQHAKAYAPLQFRSALVPVLSFTNRWVQWVLLLGILLVEAFPQLLLMGIIMFAFTTLFSIITLPVEMDASRRALIWLNYERLTSEYSHAKAQSALRWAGLTYVIAAVASIATLAYYATIFLAATDE